MAADFFVSEGPYGEFESANNASQYNRRQQGVFGENPLATPKYAVNRGLRDAEYKETLARMYVSLADADSHTRTSYLKSLPGDPQIQALAQVLIGNGNATQSTGFIDFFLQQASESYQEKMQVDEVVADNYVAFYFGQAPPVFQYAGMLLNSQQDDQVTGFALAYQHLIRGTQLARRGTLLRLRYDNVIVSGTVNAMSRTLNADLEMACPFTFSILVKEVVYRKLPNFTKMSMSDFVQLSTAFDPEGILKGVGQVSDVRVRTTTILPATQRDTSVAGQEESDTPVDKTQPAPQQLASQTQTNNQSPVTTDTEQDPSSLLSLPPPTPYVPNASFSGG